MGGDDQLRVLIDEPRAGVRNMAVDEALMRSVATSGGPTLRFYRWKPGCLSFGRNQTARGAYDGEAAAALGIDVVRRPTGGRAVYHARELTYSVTAPADSWGSLREAYRRINRALAGGLRELGVPVECGEEERPNDRAPRPTARACFADPLPGEVTAAGRKLVGSAQWRDGGCLLQHGSLLFVDDQATVDRLRTQQPATHADSAGPSPGAASLSALLDAPPSFADLVVALVRGFEREFRTATEMGVLSEAEETTATGLEARYADPEWTWRL